MSNPAYKDMLRWIQVVSTFFTFFMPALIVAYYLSKKPFTFLGFNGFISKKQYGYTVLIILSALPLSAALGEVNEMIPLTPALTAKFKALEDQYTKQITAISSIKDIGDYFASLVLIALLPAFFEEMLFRGGVQNLLFRQSKNLWLSVIFTSILFSAIHLSFYGFLPRLMLGMVLGLLFQWSGSLWLSVLAHFLNNAIGVTQLYWYQQQGKTPEQAMKENELPIWLGLIGLILVIGFFIQLYKQAQVDKKTLVPAQEPPVEEDWMK